MIISEIDDGKRVVASLITGRRDLQSHIHVVFQPLALLQNREKTTVTVYIAARKGPNYITDQTQEIIVHVLKREKFFRKIAAKAVKILILLLLC